MRAIALLFLAGCGSAQPSNPDAASIPTDSTTVGWQIGNRAESLPVVDCDTGASASIEGAFGANATWVFAAHTHCPTCQATADFTAALAKNVAPDGVAVIHLVYDDNGVSCSEWRMRHGLGGLANVKVFGDPNGAAWSAIKRTNTTAATVILDRRRIVTFAAHGQSQSSIEKQLDAALARP